MHRYVCVDITVTIICQPNCSPDGLAVMEDVVRQHRQRDNSNEQCEYLPKISISYVHKTPPIPSRTWPKVIVFDLVGFVIAVD